MKACLALCLVGCVTGDPEPEVVANQTGPAEQTLHFVARVYRANGNAVEFYEPIPGSILISETGLAGGGFLDSQSLHQPIPQLLAAIAPDQPVPPALAQAIARADAKAAAQPENVSRSAPSFSVDRSTKSVSAEPANGLTPYTTGACNQTWFTNTQCNLTPPYWAGGQWEWSECLVPWSNGAYGTCNMNGYRYTEFWTSLCADIGNMTLKVTVNPGGVGGTWTVNQGYVRNFDWYRYDADLDGHAEVDNASGDRFLFAVNCLHENS